MKRNAGIAIAIVAALGLAGPSAAAGLAEARLMSPEGKVLGKAVFTEGSQGVMLVVNVSGLTPGYHGLHIHETGTCQAPDFKSAGGHYNPHGKEHGRKNPAGPHAGDLPNLLAAPDGTAAGVFHAPLVTFQDGEGSLLRAGGTALVIHSGADDHLSQPTGGAGGRAACGVITALSE